MKKILTIIGARPQFIKAAAVSRAIARQKGLAEVIVHTGQHFDQNMSQIFFEQMGIPRPDYNLDIHSMSHGAMTGKMLEKLEAVMLKEKPAAVMVYGDTNSTLAGALAASKLHIPLAHVEAGLRSHNMKMPEEINRILTDRVSSYLFCPTPVAIENLKKEGYEGFNARMLLTGDVMYDACLFFSQKSQAPEIPELPENFLVATVHRAENTDEPENLSSIVAALNALSEKEPVVFPIHPRTRKLIGKKNIPSLSENVMVTEPMGYLEMIHLLKHCRMVLTDSGGLQKEAYFFQKPCITLREETEWTELVDAGLNKLCGSNKSRIQEAYDHFSKQKITFREGLYGDGNAAELIAAVLAEN